MATLPYGMSSMNQINKIVKQANNLKAIADKLNKLGIDFTVQYNTTHGSYEIIANYKQVSKVISAIFDVDNEITVRSRIEMYFNLTTYTGYEYVKHKSRIISQGIYNIRDEHIHIHPIPLF